MCTFLAKMCAFRKILTRHGNSLVFDTPRITPFQTKPLPPTRQKTSDVQEPWILIK